MEVSLDFHLAGVYHLLSWVPKHSKNNNQSRKGKGDNMKKVILLGVEITTRNQREEQLVTITRQMCNDILQWMDENSTDEIISDTSKEARHRIAERNTDDVNGLFRAMYFLDMIKESQYFWLDDILLWNGAD